MWGGISDRPSTFGANYRSVVPTRTPLSLLIHLDITQETDTLSRLQKDYSSHPQESPVGNSKRFCGRGGKVQQEFIKINVKLTYHRVKCKEQCLFDLFELSYLNFEYIYYIKKLYICQVFFKKSKINLLLCDYRSGDEI